MITVYLSGPIADCTDKEAGEWRQYATTAFALYGIKTIDPFIQRDYRDKRDYNEAEVVEADKADIDASDALLVNYWKTGTGTAMEVLYAWERKKRIITVFPKDLREASPWLRYHSEKMTSLGLIHAIQLIVELKWPST